tara:strand:+ start:33431 stop:33574 length:144 start_codon:yes stop_codon:yes gene_type:complete
MYNNEKYHKAIDDFENVEITCGRVKVEIEYIGGGAVGGVGVYNFFII